MSAVAYSSIASQLRDLLRSNDTYNFERRLTAKYKRGWRECGPIQCAICGVSEPGAKIDAAHIRALEENGVTCAENLVPLCSTTLRDRRHHGGSILQRLVNQYEDADISLGQAAFDVSTRIGCHDLLDYGLIPKESLRGLHSDLIQQRTCALSLTLKILGGESGIRTKGSRIEKARVDAKVAVDINEKIAAECVLISRLRRTSNVAVVEASERCGRLELLFNTEGISDAVASRALYEMALTAQVCIPQTELQVSKAYLVRLCAAVDPFSASWGISELALIQCEFFTATRREMSTELLKWLSRQEDALRRITEDQRMSPHTRARWRMNCLLHRAQLLVKAALINSREYLGNARKALADAWKFRDKTTVETGWGRFHGVLLTILEGILLQIEGQDEEALAAMARALRTMATGRGKRPEGLKDIALCVAVSFQRLGNAYSSTVAKSIGDGIVDQRSSVYWG